MIEKNIKKNIISRNKALEADISSNTKRPHCKARNDALKRKFHNDKYLERRIM